MERKEYHQLPTSGIGSSLPSPTSTPTVSSTATVETPLLSTASDNNNDTSVYINDLSQNASPSSPSSLTTSPPSSSVGPDYRRVNHLLYERNDGKDKDGKEIKKSKEATPKPNAPQGLYVVYSTNQLVVMLWPDDGSHYCLINLLIGVYHG
jgi:hypothetical protein